MEPITGLAGLYFTASDDEYFVTGKVLAAIEPVVFLIQYDGRTRELPMELVSLATMLDKRWEFFATRKEMEAWIAFVDKEPEGPRIVTFPKK